MPQATRTALVLAGHGSHISAQTAGIVWQYVDALRTMGAADQITAAFWKETPSFHTVMRTLTADDITVVPVFTANGYFTRTVIPTEMGLTGAVTQRCGKVIRYTPPLGTHPRLRLIVQQRVLDALKSVEFPASDIAVALIGHSTRRNPESRSAAEAQAAYLRSLNLVGQVEAVYLDDDPSITMIYEISARPAIIAVPFFLAAGSHTTIDVPEQLGLAYGETRAQIRGRSVYYTAPLGIDNELCEIILDLAHEAGMPPGRPSAGSAWSGFPQAGWHELLLEVEQTATSGQPLILGQLSITPTSIRVAGDANAAAAITTPAALRAKVRESPFRPLATTRDLTGGWHVPITSPQQICAVVETVYPGVLADWSQRGRFVANTLQAITARQTGAYRLLSLLTAEQIDALQTSVCGLCLRHPTWHDRQVGTVPCYEPCNLWLSAALEKLKDG